MRKRSLSGTEKVELVLASIQEGVVITKFCAEHKIARSSFYSWKNAVLKQLSEGLSRREPYGRKV
jgi:transposase-like protein